MSNPPWAGAVVPEGAPATWGARVIVTQDGHVDFVADRMGGAGPEKQGRDLLFLLNTRMPPSEMGAILRDLLREGWMETRAREDFILYMDDDLIVHANTNASAGYCYVTAWLTPVDEDEFGHCDTCGARCDAAGCTADRAHVVAIPFHS